MENLDNQIIVSIKCLVYNHAPYIRQCLDGFVMQKTNFRFEAIIHDDASTDGTQEIIREYAEKYPEIIKPIYEKENQYSKHDGSIRKIMNEVISPFTKYIAICEGDDYWTDPYKLQKQVDFLECNTEYIICSHDYIKYNQHNNTFESNTYYHQLFNKKEYEGVKFITYSLNSYFDGWWTQPLTCLYRSGDYLNKIPSKLYKNYRDDILFYYIIKEGKGAVLQDNMGVYRIHEGGSWSSSDFINNKVLSLENAFDIYKIEQDKRAFKKINRLQFEITMILRNQGNNKESFKKFCTYMAMNPFPYNMYYLYNVFKGEIWRLFMKLKSLKHITHLYSIF